MPDEFKITTNGIGVEYPFVQDIERSGVIGGHEK